MAKLIWIGTITQGSAVPLPEGWPARDHDEPEASLAKAKVASKLYQYHKPPKEG